MSKDIKELDLEPLRSTVPDTGKLQQRILSATQDMPQDIVEQVQGTKEKFWLGWLAWKPISFALVASVVLALYIWSPFGVEPFIQKDPVQTAEASSKPAEALSIDELELHELVLLHDELVFAQL